MELLDKFISLRDAWKYETRFSSSLTEICGNENYLEIIKLGRPVVPLIMQDLKDNGLMHWAVALEQIVGESPFIPEEDYGKLKVIIDLWFKWWEEHKDQWASEVETVHPIP